MRGLSHIATARLDVPAHSAFDFLADPVKLGRWSLGCMQTEPTGQPGVYRGRSLYDGNPAWFEIEADPSDLSIAYHIGTPERRLPRIRAQVVRPEICGLPRGSCYASLIAWRCAGMDDERWARLCFAHETEITLIKAQCESENEPAK